MSSQESKEQEIILASHDLFTRFGYSKTTMEDIGDKVGLNQASLYHYFKKGKEEIFLNVIFYRITELRENIEEALRQEKKLERKLEKYFAVKFDFLQKDSFLRQVIDLDFKKLPLKTKKRIQNILSTEKELIASIFQDAINKQEIRKIDPLKTAEIMIHLIEGIRFTQLKQIVLEGQIINRKEINDELKLTISYILNGIKLK
ncbi:MAG: TetR/AcrR family transcriptional regulator [Promethearchaeota archaeon]|nr:MAG: TetR/AcrR family transcriptional regulator [Candidatus Lokiarchaeota archaeon]